MSDTDEDSKWKQIKKKITPKPFTFAKLSYLFLLALGFAFAVLLRDHFFNIVYKIKYCPSTISPIFQNNGTCVYPYQDYVEPWWFDTFGVKLTGFTSVHRITFSLAVYFFFHFLLSLIGLLPNSRVKFTQFSEFLNTNGCVMAIKYVCFFVFCGLMFFIHDGFFIVIAWFSIFIAAIFLLIQVVLLIELAWGWQDTFNKMDEDYRGEFDDDEGCRASPGSIFYILTTVVIYAVAAGFTLYMFIVFCWGKCWYLIVIMIISTLASLFLIIMSYIPALGTGILPPAIVAFYASYMCYSALLSFPNKKCNMFSNLGSLSNGSSTIGGVNLNNFGQIFSIVCTAVFAVITTVYSALSTGKSGGLRKALCIDWKQCCDKEDDGMLEEDDDSEEKEQAISIVEFHLVCILVSFFFGTILTNWEVKEVDSDLDNYKYNINVGYVSFGVKLVMEVIALLLMFWVAIKKKFIDDREDEDDF